MTKLDCQKIRLTKLKIGWQKWIVILFGWQNGIKLVDKNNLSFYLVDKNGIKLVDKIKNKFTKIKLLITNSIFRLIDWQKWIIRKVVKLLKVDYWLRPYQEENTTSRPISEVKPLRARLVLGLEITREHRVSQSLPF